MEKAIPGVEDVIKYVSEVVEMPRWTPMNYKPSCSKWCDPSDRIYEKYEIYDPYMGKGDGKRRGQSGSTVGVMIDRMDDGGEGGEQGGDRVRRFKEQACQEGGAWTEECGRWRIFTPSQR